MQAAEFAGLKQAHPAEDLRLQAFAGMRRMMMHQQRNLLVPVSDDDMRLL